MTTTHTPGPWLLKIRPSLANGSDATVAEITLPAERGKPYRGDIAYLQSAENIGGIGKGELIANARLIAAAPDMLEALHSLQNQMTIARAYMLAMEHRGELHGGLTVAEWFDDPMSYASAAIAKVEG